MKRYHFQTNGACKPEAVIKGDQYRITLLTPSLVRLEYSENGDFEDRATQSVINRDFDVPQYTLEKTANGIVVETEKLRLTYDESPSPRKACRSRSRRSRVLFGITDRSSTT